MQTPSSPLVSLRMMCDGGSNGDIDNLFHLGASGLHRHSTPGLPACPPRCFPAIWTWTKDGCLFLSSADPVRADIVLSFVIVVVVFLV